VRSPVPMRMGECRSVPCNCGQDCGHAPLPRTESRTAAASRCIVGVTCE
jgi:hypothetical protein